jgi:hypothetical protein
VKGRLVQHRAADRRGHRGSASEPAPARRNISRAIRCPGSERTPEEVLAKNRERARKKKLEKQEALVASWRGNASVMLDALLTKRDDLDAEFDRDAALRVALKGYRQEHPKTAESSARGLLWVSGREEHKIYCRFCGQRVAVLERGQWSKSTAEEHFELVGRHVLICSLQYLAGLRKTVPPGTRIDPDQDLSPQGYLPDLQGPTLSHSMSSSS